MTGGMYGDEDASGGGGGCLEFGAGAPVQTPSCVVSEAGPQAAGPLPAGGVLRLSSS